MDDTHKILKLISRGEAAEILSEPDLEKKLNKLNQHELIEMVDGVVILSEKGRVALKLGLETHMTR